jgi:hypothetical protein
MTLTDEHINEIAELLDCGEVCFFHEPTGTLEHYPDPDNLYFEPEFWQETMDKVESDRSNYQRFEKMDSRQGFQVMEDFANSLTDENFRTRLFEQLAQRKPFSKFKWAIDNSEHRQDWFDFKHQANIKWVGKQVHLDNS